jgi:hypothetical protein
MYLLLEHAQHMVYQHPAECTVLAVVIVVLTLAVDILFRGLRP